MPKINVYLPDELAEAVKQAGVPVSAVCQRALEQAVRRVTAIRQTVLTDLDLSTPTGALTHLTSRARTVLKLATDQATAEGAASVGTEHLLNGMLTEGANLALHVLRAMDISLEQIKRDLAAHHQPPATGSGDDATRTFSGPAANALEFAVTEATSLGHNYVGCEHFLLGLVAEPDGTAGQVLRALGAEPRLARRAVTAALAGYVHLRAQTQSDPAQGQAQAAAMLTTAIRNELQPLIQRLERLEERMGLES
ncbi:ATP-dependent Clp protease ATP-binding subunit [Nonomuraea turkmeniaca]|uniref:ATP-dependent Clp protease ATP-binding subunit n=1 Tax=Nonomuraea turkmeniaca TaxID=103838 RepID=A0A5S4F9E6_9ACTN|nr:Clp protease N-terminal domain-containing protein [Nonomuraea turkmeniaca]TMR13593.1 ATP-dependent Clp protease ATP-binding subunit [Nonomuraea turkmeniaca]